MIGYGLTGRIPTGTCVACVLWSVAAEPFATVGQFAGPR